MRRSETDLLGGGNLSVIAFAAFVQEERIGPMGWLSTAKPLASSWIMRELEAGSTFVGSESRRGSVSHSAIATILSMRKNEPARDQRAASGRVLSFIRREFEAAAGDGGGAVVAARSKFDPAIHDPEIKPMDEAAIATLLTKVAHAWPRLFAI